MMNDIFIIWDGYCPVCGGRLSLENPDTDTHLCDTCDFWFDVFGVHYPDGLYRCENEIYSNFS